MPQQGDHAFGEYLRQARLERQWSLREAAQRVGIAHSRLDEIERMIDARSGKWFVPSYVNVVKIAKAYGLPPDELLRRAGYEPGIELSALEWRMIKVVRRLPETELPKLLEYLETLEAQTESK